MTHAKKNLLIVWNDSHRNGIEILDEQHRAFAVIVNTVHYSLSVQHKLTFLHPVIDMTIGLARIHFKTEMEMLLMSEYPLAEEHKGQHDQIVNGINNIGLSCLEGEDPDVFLDFLKECWQKHILHADMAYGEHLIKFFQSHQRVIKKK
jgi:hemerythrin